MAVSHARDTAGSLMRSRTGTASAAHEGILDAAEELSRGARRYRAGQEIVCEGKEVGAAICVLRGWLSLTKSLEDGDSQIIDFLLPGDADQSLSAPGQTAPFRIEALTEAEVAIVDWRSWDRLQRDNEGLRQLSRLQAGQSFARIAERMLRLGKGSAQVRLAYALIELCVRLWAGGAAREGEFRLPLTQQRLGEFTGLSAVHVCRTLRRFVRAGILEVYDHMTIEIRDMGALCDIAGVEAAALEAEIAGPSAPARSARRLMTA